MGLLFDTLVLLMPTRFVLSQLLQGPALSALKAVLKEMDCLWPSTTLVCFQIINRSCSFQKKPPNINAASPDS